MGLVTLEDVLEAILQDRIYDEEDISDRDLASAKLTQWAAKIMQRWYRNRVLAKAQKQQLSSSVKNDYDGWMEVPDEKQPKEEKSSSDQDVAIAAARATSTMLASAQLARPTPPIPEEIDFEVEVSAVSESTPLLLASALTVPSSSTAGLRKSLSREKLGYKKETKESN